MRNHQIWAEDPSFNQIQLSYLKWLRFISYIQWTLRLPITTPVPQSAEVSEDTKEAEKTAGNWIDEAVPISDILGGISFKHCSMAEQSATTIYEDTRYEAGKKFGTNKPRLFVSDCCLRLDTKGFPNLEERLQLSSQCRDQAALQWLRVSFIRPGTSNSLRWKARQIRLLMRWAWSCGVSELLHNWYSINQLTSMGMHAVHRHASQTM